MYVIVCGVMEAYACCITPPISIAIGIIMMRPAAIIHMIAARD